MRLPNLQSLTSNPQSLPLRYFIKGNASLAIAFEAVDIRVAGYGMFGFAGFDPLTPVSITAEFEVAFHQFADLRLRKPELKANGVKRRAVFPRHFDDAVDICIRQGWRGFRLWLGRIHIRQWRGQVAIAANQVLFGGHERVKLSYSPNITAAIMFDLNFVQLYRQIIRVRKECKRFAGVFINPDRFGDHAFGLEFCNGRLYIVNTKSEMAQTTSFRPRNPRGRIGEGEEFYYILTIQRKVEFIGCSVCAVNFCDDL